MKKTNSFKRKKKIKKIDDFEDLVFQDHVEDHEDDDLDDDLDVIPHDDDVDLVEDALEEIIEDCIIVEEEIEEKPKQRKRKSGGDKEKYYVDPKELDDEIVKYYENGILTDKLAKMVSMIPHKLSYSPNFINYSFRDEMVGDAVIRIFKVLMGKKYNRDKGTNFFSYATRICFNCFVTRIKKEKKIQETHERYQNELLNMSSNFNVLTKNNNTRIGKARDI
jgi:hypothetical protein